MLSKQQVFNRSSYISEVSINEVRQLSAEHNPYLWPIKREIYAAEIYKKNITNPDFYFWTNKSIQVKNKNLYSIFSISGAKGILSFYFGIV